MAGLLGGFFNFVDPILDKIDPMHNKVQTWTTGSETTEGQSPYFQAIAPVIIDAFLPGVGSAIGGLDGASTGNWGKAALGAMGAAGQLGSLGSAAADGANGGLAATEATSGLASTGGEAAGTVASSAPVAESGTGLLSNSGQTASGMETLGASGSGISANVANPYAGSAVVEGGSAVAPSQYVGLGGKFSADANASASQLAAQGAGKGTNWGGLATSAGKLYLQQTASAEQQAKERAMMQQMQARAAMGGSDAGAQTGRPAQSFQTLSPYAKFNGGFQGRQYGANVRNRGLLG